MGCPRQYAGLCVAAVAMCAAWAAAGEALIRDESLEVRLDRKTHTLSVADREAGAVLTGLSIYTASHLPREASADMGFAPKHVEQVLVAGNGREMVLRLKGGAVLRVRLEGKGRLGVHMAGHDGEIVRCRARAAMGTKPMIAMDAEQAPGDKGVLVTTLGPAQVAEARSLFDPERDLLVACRANGRWMRRRSGTKGWALVAMSRTASPLLRLEVRRHYYRDSLGIRHYAPIRKRPRWPTAPVVAMTWYGIQGWKGKPAQTKEWLFPNIDWVAKHLLPYAGPNLVFQLDDNYLFDDDTYMRALSDAIRSKGLVPGIWFTPFTVAPAAVAAEHPEWFVRGQDGKPLGSFGGKNWPKHMTLNVAHPEAVKQWFAAWWRKTSETWNFEFFKIDGQPQVIARYRQATNGGDVDGYRRGLALARSIVGREKFINGCWGIPLEGIGHMDGSRTGGDTGNKGHAIDVVLRWNFLNNVCWYCDPDAAANLFRATVERTRLNAQARVLTGQQFLTDDVWVKVPPAVRRVWQLSFPMLDIRPVNLYRINDWQRYDLFDLRIARPWGTWDVVGLFHYDNTPAAKPLDLGRLPLGPGHVHVYEFWSSTYLGEFPNDAVIARSLEPHEGQVFAVVPVSKERPDLVSTSRHVSQGGLDLAALAWTQSGETWTAKGRSTHLVAGDPYELVFATGRFEATKGTASQGKVTMATDGPVCRVRIEPARSGEAEWAVAFAPIQGPRVALSPGTLDVAPGAIATVQVRSLGTEAVRVDLRPSDPRIALTPAAASLGPWPASQVVTATVRAQDLKPGQTWTGQIAALDAKTHKPLATVAVRVHTPPPENLARKAKATASSEWPGGYQAARAVDGDRSTRWNSREGDTDGCWLELRWRKPVVFNQVVIDECMDFGHRIAAWRLEAGDDQLAVIARGKQAGRHHRVALAKAVTARRVRLTVEKASVVPTILELEVFHVPPAP